MRPTRKVIIAVARNGTARVAWEGAFLVGTCDRSFGSQEEAEHFAAGVQAGLISAGLSATVEIVTVGRTWADATQREMTAAAADLGVTGADYPRTFADLQRDLDRVDPQAAWLAQKVPDVAS